MQWRKLTAESFHLRKTGLVNSHLAGLDGRLEEASRLLNGGDLDRAEALVTDVLREDEQLAQALTLAGVIAQRRGNSEIAITFVNRALAVDPNNPIAFITGGQAYRTLGNLRAAEDCLRQALKLDPGRHDAHLNLALTLWSSGEHARAGTYFKNVLLLAPQSFQAFFYLGRIHLEDADWVRAEEYLRKAVEIQPAHAEANRLLAQVLSSAGRVPEASSALERAVLANPADGGLRLAAACAAFELGYETSAFEHYRQRGLGSDTRSAGSRPMSSREIGFGPWCQEQQIETVRVARQQRHKVREVKVIPEHHRTPDMPEPNTPEVHVAQLPDCTVLPGDHLLLSEIGRAHV